MELQATGNSGVLKTLDFEKIYVSVRKKENRMYSDLQVEKLPSIEKTHLHYKEWEMRKRSVGRLKKYLERKSKSLTILEIGSGNGWLSKELSQIKNAYVTGIETNEVELRQAQRVYAKRTNLHFIFGEFGQYDFVNSYDIILFAASMQYFLDLKCTLSSALALLNEGGEIHLLDSHIYKWDEIKPAATRTRVYYQQMGFSEMSDFYFHHPIEVLNGFHHNYLYNPSHFMNKIFWKRDLFPWIRVTL